MCSIAVKQYNPNCDLLSGFRKEECQQNRENAVTSKYKCASSLQLQCCPGPVRRVLVGVAGAGGGAQPDPGGGGEDAVCQLQRRQATTTAQHEDGQT